MTASLWCYHPAVFFRRLRLTALSVAQGNIRRAFLKSLHKFFFYFFKNYVSLKLRKSVGGGGGGGGCVYKKYYLVIIIFINCN